MSDQIRLVPSMAAIIDSIIESANNGNSDAKETLARLARYYDAGENRNLVLTTDSDYRVIAFYEKPNGDSYVICELPNNNVTPFVVWLLGYDRNNRKRCPVNGAYCKTRNEAYSNFLERINL